MAAGLYENDWMFSSNGVRPWHGIGTIVKEAPTSDEAIKIAKLDWDVIQYPVIANGMEIPNYFANVRSDTNETLGVVKNRYRVEQNSEAFSFVDNIIENSEVKCKYETAGSLFNGRKVFMLVKLPKKNILGDSIENYLFFMNSHDGSSQLLAGITNVRVVCNNTLQLAINGAQRLWKCKHTENINGKVEEAKESLGFAVKYISSMSDQIEVLAAKKVNEEAFFRKLYEENPMRLGEKSLQSSIEVMHEIYNNKDDLQNFRGTAWGLYNAVSDFSSNYSLSNREQSFRGKEYKLEHFFDGDKILGVSQMILQAA